MALQFFSFGAGGSVPVWTDGPGWYNQIWYAPLQVAPQTTLNRCNNPPSIISGSSGGSWDAVELKVHFCCESGCIPKFYAAIDQVDGVGSVSCDYVTGKVTVTGSAKPEQILAAAKKVDPRAALQKKKN